MERRHRSGLFRNPCVFIFNYRRWLSMVAFITLLLNVRMIQRDNHLANTNADDCSDVANPPHPTHNLTLDEINRIRERSPLTVDNPLFLEENSLRCRLARRPNPAEVKNLLIVWQVHEYKTGKIFIYSAVFDDRPAAGPLPTVRILVVATYDKYRLAVECHLWYDGVAEPFVVHAVMNETGMNRYQFGRNGFREYTYTCPLTIAYPPPTHVSIATEPCAAEGGVDGGSSAKYPTYFRVWYTPKQRAPIQFGVCVANGYGYHPAHEFVEWMELLKMYGVKEVNLYDSLFVNMTDVFSYYRAQGVLKLRRAPFPIKAKPTDDPEMWYRKVRMMRMISLNDCMLRNMYRYEYLVVIDLDEMIVPRNHGTYASVIEAIDKRWNHTLGPRPTHSYSFRNAYYLRDFPPDTSQPLRMLQYRHRAKPSGLYYGSKSFISPLCCFNLFNHYCYTLLPPYIGKKITVFAPAELATSHHYRKCGKFHHMTCDQLFGEKTQDDVMLDVRTRLLKRVIPVLKRLRQPLMLNSTEVKI